MPVARTVIKFSSCTYKEAKRGQFRNQIIRDRSFIVITDIIRATQKKIIVTNIFVRKNRVATTLRNK